MAPTDLQYRFVRSFWYAHISRNSHHIPCPRTKKCVNIKAHAQFKFSLFLSMWSYHVELLNKRTSLFKIYTLYTVHIIYSWSCPESIGKISIYS